MRERGGEGWALGAGYFLLGVTVLWWAFALWPAPGETPLWLARARNVCFGVGESGLPDAGGWILLIGQPAGMFGLLLVGWREEVARGLVGLSRSVPGRAMLGATALLILTGAGLAAHRVAIASSAEGPVDLSTPVPLDVDMLPRLDRPVPDVELVDQLGRPAGPEIFEGEVTLVTFGFGNCETLCPVLVHAALEARAAIRRDGPDIPLVVVTLDPWRDTPSRLAPMAETWGLEEGDRILGGEVEGVEAALDAWNVGRSRDVLTGDIVHPALVYVVGPDARAAFAAGAVPGDIEAIARRVIREGRTGQTDDFSGLTPVSGRSRSSRK